MDLPRLARQIKAWGYELGFQQIGIALPDLPGDEARLLEWLEQKRHGEMHYMQRHGTRRSRPADLVPGTVRVISARMDYLTDDMQHMEALLEDRSKGYIARYALGRDYHKVLRTRLQKLATRIETAIGAFGYRAFVDSAPVLEKALARNAGLGWIGKHSNLIHPKAGSWFFLGEIYTDLELPADDPFIRSHCGNCTACIDICPTGAITGPGQVDARRCISYLTIELRDPIPVEFRRAIGNRIFGCDDCQLVCPWNRFADRSREKDFQARHGLQHPDLVELFNWSEADFLERTAGSAMRRIGWECWLRNIAVALGNAPKSPGVIAALQARQQHPSELVREHVDWALQQQGSRGV